MSAAHWRGWLQTIPADMPDEYPVTIPAGVLRELAAPARDGEPAAASAVQETAEPSWRERLWTAPAETRIGPAEVCEALGRPRSWLYRHTSKKSTTGDGGYSRIPHRKLEGDLVFVVGELREWIRRNEDVVQEGQPERSATERGHLREIPNRRTGAL